MYMYMYICTYTQSKDSVESPCYPPCGYIYAYIYIYSEQGFRGVSVDSPSPLFTRHRGWQSFELPGSIRIDDLLPKGASHQFRLEKYTNNNTNNKSPP